MFTVHHNSYRVDYCWITKHTPKALLVMTYELGEMWFPRSQIIEQEDYGIEGGVLVIEEWLAIHKGFVPEENTTSMGG